MKAIAVIGFILAGFTGAAAILGFLTSGKTDREMEQILPLIGAAVAWAFACCLIYLLAEVRDALVAIHTNTSRIPLEKN